MPVAADVSPVCLIVPALEPADELVSTIEGLAPGWAGPMVVVDDGSASEHAAAIFERVKSLGCAVLTHPKNRGKGAALKTALAWCREHAPQGCVGAVTADADGQHLVQDILAVADALREHPDDLILGCRDFSAEDVPTRSRFGNRFMSATMKLLFGMRLSDTQTGLRGIPLAFMAELEGVAGDDYSFETNMLIETRNAGMGVAEVPIATVYTDNNASSHFNPVLDSLRVAAIFVKYALSSLASSLVDLGVFALLSPAFATLGLGELTIAAATVAARVISGAVNFFFNSRLVFGRGDGVSRREAVRFTVLWVACMCASAALVTGLSALLPMVSPLIVKIMVDVSLFFANYRIQEAWVFTNTDTADRAR